VLSPDFLFLGQTVDDSKRQDEMMRFRQQYPNTFDVEESVFDSTLATADFMLQQTLQIYDLTDEGVTIVSVSKTALDRE
jgi:hypothetical protein